jgi:hypothetical protein
MRRVLVVVMNIRELQEVALVLYHMDKKLHDIWGICMHFPLHHDIVELFKNEVHHINLLKFLAPLAIVEYFKGMGEEIHKDAT